MYDFFKHFEKIILLFLTVIFFISSGCNDSDINGIDNVVDNVIILDTLQVYIRYDDTPGFKYPLMNYDTYTVAHLATEGNIGSYFFRCEPGNVEFWESGLSIHSSEPGFRFRNKMRFWSKTFLKPNSVVPYTLWIQGFINKKSIEYFDSSTAKVEYFTDGIKPEQNSLQLTGPENKNFNPQSDGNWVYFQEFNLRKIFRTDQNGNGYETIADFSSLSTAQGRFYLIDSNHLAHVESGDQNSKIVIKNLQNLSDSVYQLNSLIWNSAPVRIPNTNKFLNLSNSSSSSYGHKLIAADIGTGKVDTLLKGFTGWVESYTINPKNNKIYLITVSNNTDVLEYNYSTDQFSVFLGNVNIRNLKFFPNGTDYAYIKRDQNNFNNIFTNINGTEKQLTTYPADVYEFSISPDGEYIFFSANRRMDGNQIWKIKLN